VESKHDNDEVEEEEEELDDTGYISTDEEDWWPDKDDIPMTKIPPRLCPPFYTQYVAIVRIVRKYHMWNRSVWSSKMPVIGKYHALTQ
jgi:hypothetical protein